MEVVVEGNERKELMDYRNGGSEEGDGQESGRRF